MAILDAILPKANDALGFIHLWAEAATLSMSGLRDVADHCHLLHHFKGTTLRCDLWSSFLPLVTHEVEGAQFS